MRRTSNGRIFTKKRVTVILIVLAAFYVLLTISIDNEIEKNTYKTEIVQNPASSDSNYNESVTVFVLGDWGLNSPQRRAIADQMNAYALIENPEFIISTGDNMYPYGLLNMNQKNVLEGMLADYKIPKIFYTIPGNHDYRGDVDSMIKLSSVEMRTKVKWRMPEYHYKRYHEFRGTVLEFFFLDTNLLVCPTNTSIFYSPQYLLECEYFMPEVWTENSTWKKFGNYTNLTNEKKKELKWTESVLSTSNENSWKILIGHHPIKSNSVLRGNNPVLEAELNPIFVQKGIDMYISGHDHTLQHLREDDIDYFVVGTGSYGIGHAMLDDHRIGKFGSKENGFMILNFKGDQMSARFINMKGEEIYRTTKTRRRIDGK
eukprot:TRINITY_DN2289_c0_g1_i9.p1 TRINITY_DN2289_c0_g1~~TRINITY_DN2289_c0_g1_i9.p1  ORF type:complete len:373 (+),score=79.26 TRINITY_DN2289_c0_g1_i9:2-1120(+)